MFRCGIYLPAGARARTRRRQHARRAARTNAARRVGRRVCLGSGHDLQVVNTQRQAPGYGFREPDKALGPYYIPDRQCSGVVHNVTQHYYFAFLHLFASPRCLHFYAHRTPRIVSLRIASQSCICLTSVCRYVNVVRVSATDAAGYPDISIDGLLERAAVRRRAGPAGCAGRVRVHVAVGCGMSRRVARAASAGLTDAPQLPQPQSRRLPPMSPPPFPVDG
ncbi:hypothetical protein RR48_06808 [Papilio machaon]|uniref:Uncharacterized protein n=1 Tax=Papilio machaon TaxID=76193 RepID=A0A194R7U4_PAPMA|nr:hypothetical protein RR48_06808 [Papilio machaon]